MGVPKFGLWVWLKFNGTNSTTKQIPVICFPANTLKGTDNSNCGHFRAVQPQMLTPTWHDDHRHHFYKGGSLPPSPSPPPGPNGTQASTVTITGVYSCNAKSFKPFFYIFLLLNTQLHNSHNLSTWTRWDKLVTSHCWRLAGCGIKSGQWDYFLLHIILLSLQLKGLTDHDKLEWWTEYIYCTVDMLLMTQWAVIGLIVSCCSVKCTCTPPPKGWERNDNRTKNSSGNWA